MSEPDDPAPSRPAQHDGPTLSADGQLEGRLSRLEPAGSTPFSAPTDEPLELAEVAPPRPQSLPGSVERVPKRRSPLKLVLLAFGLGLGLLVVALVPPSPAISHSPAATPC